MIKDTLYYVYVQSPHFTRPLQCCASHAQKHHAGALCPYFKVKPILTAAPFDLDFWSAQCSFLANPPLYSSILCMLLLVEGKALPFRSIFLRELAC